jgi:hypothetical protein
MIALVGWRRATMARRHARAGVHRVGLWWLRMAGAMIRRLEGAGWRIGLAWRAGGDIGSN